MVEESWAPTARRLLAPIAAELGLRLVHAGDREAETDAPVLIVIAGAPARVVAAARGLASRYPTIRQILLPRDAPDDAADDSVADDSVADDSVADDSVADAPAMNDAAMNDAAMNDAAMNDAAMNDAARGDIDEMIAALPRPDRRWVVRERELEMLPHLIRAAVAGMRAESGSLPATAADPRAPSPEASTDIPLEASHAEGNARARRGSEKELLDALLDAGADALVAIDTSGRVTAWNLGAERLFGAPAADALGAPLDRLLRNGPLDELMERIREASGGGPFSLRTHDAGGRELVTQVSVTQVCAGDTEIGLVMIVRDVTDQLRFEERLIESERRFRQISENIREVFWIRDPHSGAVLFAGAAYESIWGRPVQSLYLSPSSFLDQIVPEDRPGVEEALARQERGEHTETEYRIVRPDGTARWISDRGFPIADASGGIYRVVGVAEDITERRQLLGRLKAHHGVTAALAEAGDLAVAAPAILEAICAKLGWRIGILWKRDRKEDRLRCVTCWGVSDESTFLESTRHAAFAAGEGLPGMVWRRRAPIWIENLGGAPDTPRIEAAADAGLRTAVAFPILRGDELLGVMEFYADELHPREPETLRTMGAFSSQIGEFIVRRRAEAARARSDARFRILAETAFDAIITIEADGTIRYLNPAAEKIFGHPPDMLIGTSLARLMPEYRRALDGGHAELAARAGDDATVPVEVSFGEFLDDGRRMFTGIVRDISERRAAERERRALLEREQLALEQSETARARLGFLAEASDVLSGTLDVDTILTRLARLAVPGIADWCAVDLLDESGELRRLALGHVDPEKVELARRLHRQFPPTPDASGGLMKVLRTGVSEFVPVVVPEMLEAVARDATHLELLRAIGFSSAMIIPLIAHGRTLGAISFVNSDPDRHFDRNDLTLAEDLARRAALAVDNALLYHQVGAQREWLEVTLASIGDAVIATDTEGRITFINRVAATTLDLDPESAHGLPIGSALVLVEEGSGRELEHPVSVVLRTGETVAVKAHTILVASTGRSMPIEDSAAPIRDGSGAMIGVVLVFHDTTEAERAERERTLLLAEVDYQRRRLDNIVTNVPGLVWEIWLGNGGERAGGRDFVSSQIEEILGYTAREWLDSPRFWMSIIHDDDLGRIEQEAAELFGRRGNGVFRFRWRRKDGVYIWAEAHAAVILDADGEPVGMRGVTTDVTDRMSWEDDLRRAKEAAESANNAKDRFLAVLSHELRTPLTPVLSTVHALETDDDLPRDFLPYVEIIRRNVELEARLIDDLLDLTRISKGKIQLSQEVVDCHMLIRNVLEMVQADVKKKHIITSVDLLAERHHVCADPARLQQIFWNLIKNAVKFTPAEGRILIRSRNDERGRIAVEVIDTGIGIDAEVLPKIFDAFEQGEEGITRRFGGLGLGLAITRALVDLHQGAIEVSSAGKGTGATFKVAFDTLEVRPAASAEQERAEDTDGERGSLRILIVDDHEDTSRVMKMLLERRGYRVRTANSVGSALAVAEGYPFDLLISDIGLPDGTGIDLMERLRRLREVTGIALSGFGMEEDVLRSHAAGFRLHLTKPVSFSRLIEAIQEIAVNEG